MPSRHESVEQWSYDPRKVTPLAAAVIDAMSAALDGPDADSKASRFVTALKERGFIVVRDPNRPKVPYSDKARTDV